LYQEAKSGGRSSGLAEEPPGPQLPCDGDGGDGDGCGAVGAVCAADARPPPGGPVSAVGGFTTVGW
jgi:hypothetical protein